MNKNYSFLRDYRASELVELKQRLKATKKPEEKESLKRELRSHEDQERTRKRAEEEKAIIREHRKQERGKVEQGKKPYFLKRGEIKKQVLVRRFEGMGGKKAAKVMERRRKKKASKERKGMPRARREVG